MNKKNINLDWFDVSAGLVFSGFGFAFMIGVFIGLITWFQATQTGACAGQGGTASYQTDYVQCGNGNRVVYRKQDVYSGRYEVKVRP